MRKRSSIITPHTLSSLVVLGVQLTLFFNSYEALHVALALLSAVIIRGSFAFVVSLAERSQFCSASNLKFVRRTGCFVSGRRKKVLW
jgi:hypothetical protein